MKSIDIANAFIERYGDKLQLTNLKLNKLVYYAQVESLREGDSALFDDAIEAWRFGPVCRMVYDEFKCYGRNIITETSGSYVVDSRACHIVDLVASTYGSMSAFDLVTLSHKNGGAWNKVYTPHLNRNITIDDIKDSNDFEGFPGLQGTASESIDTVTRSIPNALKLLRDS